MIITPPPIPNDDDSRPSRSPLEVPLRGGTVRPDEKKKKRSAPDDDQTDTEPHRADPVSDEPERIAPPVKMKKTPEGL